WLGSLEVRTQSPVQFVVPLPHVAAQVPAEHTWPPAHACGAPLAEQAPQLASSVPVFTSQPFAAAPSQLAKPALHVPRPQTPAVQVAPALANAQRTPQPPQLFT